MDYGLTLVFGVVLITTVFSFISSKGGLTDNRRKWHKVITKRGWICIFLGIMIIILSIWQYIYQERRGRQKEMLLKKEQEEREQLIKAGIDSSNKKIFSALTEAFTNQKLIYDSSQRRIIEFFKDSSKTEPLPDLNFCAEAITVDTFFADTYSFKYNICNLLGAAKNIELKLYLMILKEDRTLCL